MSDNGQSSNPRRNAGYDQVLLMRPEIKVNFISETTSYAFTYVTTDDRNSSIFDGSVLSVDTKNAMGDDAPIFSVVVASNNRWDRYITINDLITIEVDPNKNADRVDNETIMIGLVSDIRKEGEYENGLVSYRVTGQGVAAKAMMSMNLGILQQYRALLISNIGWMQQAEGEDNNGINFLGESAKSIGQQVVEKFLFTHMKYEFSRSRGLEDFVDYDFSSWEEHESLLDQMQYVDYEGSVNQLLQDVTAKPFNEIYHQFWGNKNTIVMRRTPFDEGAWNDLPYVTISSSLVVGESISKIDSETYSIFMVTPGGQPLMTGLHLGVFPLTFRDGDREPLIEKYGYKVLQVQNKYLGSQGIDGADGILNADSGRNPVGTPPTFTEFSNAINGRYNREYARINRQTVMENLNTEFRSLGGNRVRVLVDLFIEGQLTSNQYTQVLNNYGEDVVDESGYGNDGARMKMFTEKLYNWYCENPNFESGEISVVGTPSIYPGLRLVYEDREQNTVREFYIESVSHAFSYKSGYITTLGVTRGLQEGGRHRFTNMWGKSDKFQGGFFGEKTLEELEEQIRNQDRENNYTDEYISDGGGGGGAGGSVAMQALAEARRMTQIPSRYGWGKGRPPRPTQRPLVFDCSSFVWHCFNVGGFQLRNSSTSVDTRSIRSDPRLTRISSRGSSKNAAFEKMREGDIVFFNTNREDGHVGIYAGNKRFIGSQSSHGIRQENMSSGYWLQRFNGHVLRLN